MTAEDIVKALRGKPITDLRARKLRSLCERAKVPYDLVLDLLTDTERAALNDPSLR